MRTIEHTISKQYLSALINNDYTGLEEGDKIEFTSWLDSVQDHDSLWDYDMDTLNNTYFTECGVSNLLSDCATVKQVLLKG
jgi:hypothetical protein